MAQKIWPGEDALGKRFTLDDDVTEPVEIVGIVGDVKHFGLEEDVRPELFVPVQQCSSGFWGWIDRSLHVVFKPRGDAGRAMDEMRGLVSSLDAELPIYNVQSLQGLVEESVAGRRTSLRLLASFAVVALLLAAVGIYGVMAYSVSQRTQEIGIRMALGAQRLDVLGLIVKQGAVLTLVGIGIGVAAAFGLTRWMTSQLFGVSATDPATFAGTALLIAGVSLLACWIPAWRAAGVDPTVALRHE
jgi:predicted lysophospholipase L1 biosynthesis ABC-type transport system permease subunit